MGKFLDKCGFDKKLCLNERLCQDLDLKREIKFKGNQIDLEDTKYNDDINCRTGEALRFYFLNMPCTDRLASFCPHTCQICSTLPTVASRSQGTGSLPFFPSPWKQTNGKFLG